MVLIEGTEGRITYNIQFGSVDRGDVCVSVCTKKRLCTVHSTGSFCSTPILLEKQLQILTFSDKLMNGWQENRLRLSPPVHSKSVSSSGV